MLTSELHRPPDAAQDRPAGAPPAQARASWSSWWGSPELVAQAARAGVRRMREVGRGEAGCRIVMAVDGDSERFATPDEFLLAATPEGFRRFSSLELLVQGDGCAVAVTFTRSAVRLETQLTDEDRRADAVAVAQKVAVALRRGYPRYWSGCAASAELREHAGRPLPMQGTLVMAAVVAVGTLLGAGVARALAAVPGVHLSPPAFMAVLAAVGLLYPALVARAVLDVEIAPVGSTRLLSVARKSGAALATFAVTQAIQLAVA